MLQSLRDSMQAAGFDPPDNIQPSKTTRFSTNGKRSDLSGWVHLFADGQGAAFGFWRSGNQHVWQAKRDKPLNSAEQAAFNRSIKAATKAAQDEREAGYKQAAAKALMEWEAATPADETHPYLMRKVIKPHMARVDSNGSLVLPVYGSIGELQSLQRIAPDGQKRFYSGGRMCRGHVWLGTPENGATLLLCEGFATADTLHRATGYAVCVCFSAGNLRSVAEDLRNRYQSARLLICGNDDIQTEGNPGRSKATDAAQAVAAAVVFPPYGGDFNDLAQSAGLDAVRREIEQVFEALPTTKTCFAVPALSGTDVRDGTASTRPLSELGNASRLLDAHGGNLHYVHDAKAWLHWRDGAWMWDVDGATVRGLAARLPQQIYTEGGLHLADAQHFAKWARTSQKERTIEASVSLLMDFDTVRLPLALIDADPFRLALDCGRVSLDLRTGTTRPAQQNDFITKSLNVKQLGKSKEARRWLAFLSQIFVFCFGLGANGKSVLADTIRFILGDYARAIAAETLTESKRQAGGATPDLAELIGARLAMSSETEDGAALAESFIKSLVAGDTMTARKLYAAPFQFTPQFKLMMLGNHKPIIKGNDYGIWRRVRLVPFKRTFTPEQRDPALLDKLRAESPHILAWMVEGCIEWQRRGLVDVPATIRQATGDYQDEQDLVGRWLAECCRQSPSFETSSTDIYSNYKQWCFDNGLKPASNISLGRRLGERGFNSRRSSGLTLWAGLAVKEANYSGNYKTARGW
ncbi:toprim domain-containing protein [Methylomonas sp. WH-1]|uniref:phage/plasmid primase, P4 family n=2 Tax=Methylomonas TaxID=416 RepID=UPI000ABE0D1A